MVTSIILLLAFQTKFTKKQTYQVSPCNICGYVSIHFGENVTTIGVITLDKWLSQMLRQQALYLAGVGNLGAVVGTVVGEIQSEGG